MESIVRNVKDFEAPAKEVLEAVLGQKLQESQQVMIMVLNPGPAPDPKTRAEALVELDTISRKAAENIAAQGIAPEEVEAAIDEAMEHVRPPSEGVNARRPRHQRPGQGLCTEWAGVGSA